MMLLRPWFFDSIKLYLEIYDLLNQHQLVLNILELETYDLLNQLNWY